MFWFFPRLSFLTILRVSSSLFGCASAARGRQYLEETKLRLQEGQRARTEARKVQLTLTDLKTRISDLERFRWEVERKSTARDLPFDSAFISTSLFSSHPFHCLILLCLYVVPSWPHAQLKNEGVRLC